MNERAMKRQIMMIFKTRLSKIAAMGVILSGAFALMLSARSAIEPLDHYGEVAKAFARRFPEAHLMQQPLDASLSARAWTNYLSALDFDRSYFTQADLETFDAYRLTLGDQLLQGDTAFAFTAFDLFKERLEERYTFTTNLLAQGFTFDTVETYAPRRQHAAWPVDRESQDVLWRRRIKNEVLGQELSRLINEATNAVPGVADLNDLEYPDGPKPVDSDTDGALSTDLDPTSYVARRYAQFRMVIQDSDAEWVMQRFMSAMASAFDPHSAYMSPVTLEDFNIDMQLSLVGIGALLRPEDGAAKIVSLIPGGPAERDRRDIALRPGDKIIGVGQDDDPIKDVLHLPLYRTVRKIRGEPGSRVVLRVIPASDPSGATTKVVDLIREEVKLEEQAASSRIVTQTDSAGAERRLGIIRLPAFYASMQTRDTSADGFRSATYDVARALADLNAEGVEGLLLDLRNNSGGSLREAIEMTGLFIRTGPVVQVREIHQIHVLEDRDPAVAFRLPMVVLVNRLSASASEILAGALQDYGRALIVGDSSTHGKGSVQTIVPLNADDRLGSIKVTTANYYRISGGSTQLRGIVPDVVVPSIMDAMDLGESRLPNPMPWTQVPPASFQPLADLTPLVEPLTEQSEARREACERFVRYNQLVRHVREMNARREVPLEWEARKTLVEAEHEIRRAQASVAEGRQDDQNGEDPVLDEVMQILADLVQRKPVIEALEGPDPEPDPLREIIRRIFPR